MSQSQVDMAVSPPNHIGTPQAPPVSPRQSPVRVSAPAAPKRHRPKSLNLNPASPPEDSRKKPNKNADMALRIVSPGLPILNEEMETTVKISQKIELQQRHLIAARQAGGASAGSPSSGTPVVSGSSGTSPATVPTPTGSANTSVDDSNSPPVSHKNTHSLDDKLSAPASAKRLKRDNIPTPLSIAPIPRAPQSYKPSIQSAPIRYASRIPVSARYPAPPQGRRYPPSFPSGVPLTPHPYGVSVQRRYRPIPNTQVTYSALPGHQAQPQIPTTPYRRVRMVPPHTTTSPYFPRGVRRTLMSTGPAPPAPSAAQQEGKPYYVTDIYHGDLMKAAPLQSQPLSAQRDFFESSSAKPTPTTSHKMIEEDRLPVSDEEVREMQEKYKRNSEEEKPDENKAGDMRPYGYHTEYQSHQYGPSFRSSKPGEIFGSINLMNESVFNFRIFAQTPESGSRKDDDVEDRAIEKENENSDKSDNEKSEDDKERSPSGSPATKDEESSDWLAKEKDKFLKICETSWDEFVNSRKMAPDW